MSVGHRRRDVRRTFAVAALAMLAAGCSVEVAGNSTSDTTPSATATADPGTTAAPETTTMVAPTSRSTLPPTGSSGSPGAPGDSDGGALEALLPDADYVPEGYAAEVVPADRRAGVVASATAVGPGAVVDPTNCAPQPVSSDSALLLATDPNSANLMVLVERVDGRLSHLVEQWRNCAQFTVTTGSTVQRHMTEMTAAPPVSTDESAALRTVVDGGADGQSQNTLTLAAQQGDLRITAVAVGRDGDLDTAALDSLFTETVLNVQNS